VTRVAPKPKRKEETAPSTLMDAVCRKLDEAFLNVASNKGAPGPDRQSIDEVREHLSELMPKLTAELVEGSFKPGDVRRVWIPKAGGGQRGLGIPNVISDNYFDRSTTTTLAG
jgi:retron-type reverse transcriptase